MEFINTLKASFNLLTLDDESYDYIKENKISKRNFIFLFFLFLILQMIPASLDVLNTKSIAYKPWIVFSTSLSYILGIFFVLYLFAFVFSKLFDKKDSLSLYNIFLLVSFPCYALGCIFNTLFVLIFSDMQSFVFTAFYVISAIFVLLPLFLLGVLNLFLLINYGSKFLEISKLKMTLSFLSVFIVLFILIIFLGFVFL